MSFPSSCRADSIIRSVRARIKLTCLIRAVGADMRKLTLFAILGFAAERRLLYAQRRGEARMVNVSIDECPARES